MRTRRDGRLNVGGRTRAVLLVGAALIGSGCQTEQVTEEVSLRPVRTTTLETVIESRERTFSGISQASLESRLSFKVSGTVIDLRVKVGDHLRKGDLIALLDPVPYELEAERARASLGQAEANDRNAAAAYERVKELYENNNASRNDLDAARAQAESAKAQVKAAEKALELAQLSVGYTRLVVDFDCSVAQVAVEVNENVGSGTPVAIVNCGDAVEVATAVPETLIAGISPGMPATVRFGALPGVEHVGTVTQVGVASGGAAATFPVTVRLDADPAGLRAGLAADVVFTFPADEGTSEFVVPSAAVIRDESGTWVNIAEDAGQAGEAIVRRRAVTLGELTENGLEVRDGLERGDRVITAGATVVRDGQRVLLPN